MTKDKFFEELLSGATWSAGVAFKRSNPLPLDRYSVFQSYDEALEYATENAVAYPGQVVAVVDGEPLTATVYVIDVNAEGVHSLKEVGTKPVGDGKSIEIKNDKITIYGFEEAAAQTYPRKKEDGTIEWVTVQELVEGATENTITVGDAKSIASEKTETGYELSLNGFDEAEEGQIAVKMGGNLHWKKMPTLSDLGGISEGDLDTYDFATTEYVDDEIDKVVAIANGKTNTYVVNNLTNSDSNFATLGKEDVIINSGYVLVDGTQTHPKIGDIYLIKELAYVDRWVSAIDQQNHTFTLSALETEKVDLNGYATEDYVDDALGDFVKSVNGINPVDHDVTITSADIVHGENGDSIEDSLVGLHESVQGLSDTKLNKTLTEEVVYNREGTKTNDVEALLKGMASEVASHDYQIESIQGTLGGLDSKYVQIPQDDEYVLKSVYDAHVEEFDAASQAILSQGQNIADLQKNINETIPATYVTQESLVEQVQLLQGQIDDIVVPDVSDKEDKGKLTATTPSSGNRNGVYYVPLTDKALDSNGDTNLVQLVSGDGSHPLAVQMTNDGILLKAGTSGKVSINGNAETASVANALAASATVNVNQLVQTEGEFLTLNGGSADSRA